jgi:hypothetical protein
MSGGFSDHVLLSPGMDRIFDALCERHRRLILLTLHQTGSADISELRLRGNDDPDITEIHLRHSHLPKLEDIGYVEWDEETDTISKGPRFSEIEPLLELIENHADELPDDWP